MQEDDENEEEEEEEEGDFNEGKSPLFVFWLIGWLVCSIKHIILSLLGVQLIVIENMLREICNLLSVAKNNILLEADVKKTIGVSSEIVCNL
jgi:hypothetical protein